MIAVYKIIGQHQVKTRIAACLDKGLTPFVDRRREIRQLMECFDGVKEGRGQVMEIVGEPGVGKSRLVCQFRPLVIVMEDLHWIDRTSQDFITYLINLLASAKILLILLYRPKYIPAWVSKTYYNQVRVGQFPRK